MKKLLCLMAAGAALSGVAAASEGGLPEIVAYAGTVPIRRDRVAVTLPASDPGYREAVRKAVEAEWNWIALSRILKLQPSVALAKRYISLRIAQTPESERAAFLRKFEPLAAHKDFQLKAALQLQFLSENPEQMRITAPEIETFYRNNRARFRIPGRADLSIMKFGPTGEKTMERARSAYDRLLQGEPFNAVAAKFDPGGERKVPPPGAALKLRFELESMKEKEFRIITSPFGVVYLVLLNRKLPPALVPIENVAPYIREELAAEKLKNVLEHRMEAERKRLPLRLCY